MHFDVRLAKLIKWDCISYPHSKHRSNLDPFGMISDIFPTFSIFPSFPISSVQSSSPRHGWCALPGGDLPQRRSGAPGGALRGRHPRRQGAAAMPGTGEGRGGCQRGGDGGGEGPLGCRGWTWLVESGGMCGTFYQVRMIGCICRYFVVLCCSFRWNHIFTHMDADGRIPWMKRGRYNSLHAIVYV